MKKQYYKAIYFDDYPSNSSKDKSITIAFNESEVPYFNKIKHLTTIEIKELIALKSYQQLSLFAATEDRSINQTVKRLIKQNLPKIDQLTGTSSTDVTFRNSKDVPFQRWYPYIEGYSPNFIYSLVDSYNIPKGIVYDPFSGTGTTIFTVDKLGFPSVYSEVNPLLQFLTTSKIKVLQLHHKKRLELAFQLKKYKNTIFERLENVKEDEGLAISYKLFNSKRAYFSTTTYSQVLRFRTLLDEIALEHDLSSKVLTIALLACLIKVSFLKKAGDVRFKTPKEVGKESFDLKDILPQKIDEIISDIENTSIKLNNTPKFILSNAKNIALVHDLGINTIITSPPYLNGTNYFRNTKLELWFLRYLNTKEDLRLFRDKALTSGINDVRKNQTSYPIDISSKSPLLKKTLVDLQIESYDSRIPIMARSYFEEMYIVFQDVRKHLKKGAKILIDIGDSIFAGVHIKTDEILIELFKTLGYTLEDRKVLRQRRSRNRQVLVQSLIVLKYDKIIQNTNAKIVFNLPKWNNFKKNLPHQQSPYSKRNWGHKNHSICSYQGKLKPAIAYHLVDTFVPKNGRMLDPFSGVGTIPFEAALSGKFAFGLDISKPAYYISSAKIANLDPKKCEVYLDDLQNYIGSYKVSKQELEETKQFGYNKKINAYYEDNTLNEILAARQYFKEQRITDPNLMLLIACLLHILHGNRPYALSRRSHSIVPYAPQGEFIYKNLVEKLTEKVNRVLNYKLPLAFKAGKVFLQDCTDVWPQEINDLDAIITSPPFYGSTRFHSANWIRLWFTGWSAYDFKHQIHQYVEEKQKINFNIYESIFRQSRERLKKDGICVFHLGKSVKCDMAEELQKISKQWFKTADLFDESVLHCESHGIRDKGTVTSHQYLLLK